MRSTTVRSYLTLAVLAANAVLLCASDITVTFDAGGNTIGKVPDLRPGDRLKFKFDELDAKTKLKLIYEMPSDDDGDGRPLGCRSEEHTSELQSPMYLV